MSCGQWDDMLTICNELAEYASGEAVIRTISETTSKIPINPKDCVFAMPEPVKQPIKIRESVGSH